MNVYIVYAFKCWEGESIYAVCSSLAEAQNRLKMYKRKETYPYDSWHISKWETKTNKKIRTINE